jgi:hypothetical protein
LMGGWPSKGAQGLRSADFEFRLREQRPTPKISLA